MGNKSSSAFKGLLNYILRDGAAMKNKEGIPYMVKHNISGNSIAQFEKVFRENEANRKYRYKGSNVCYHVILSFSPEDTDKLTLEMLEDLTRKFFELRAEYGMGVAAYHEDRNHRHIHCILGNTKVISGESLRMSRKEFQQVKEKLQEYQQLKYPELVSVPDHNKRNENQISNEEFQLKARTEKASRKDELREYLHKAFEESMNREEFQMNLKSQGLNLYERGGQIAGIDDGNRHYRLGTLGIYEENMQELSARNDRMEILESIREGDQIQIERGEQIVEEHGEEAEQQRKENID